MPPTQPALPLATSTFSACWDLTKARLEADAGLRAGGVLVEFAEDADQLRPPEQLAGRPVVQVFGSLGRVQWHHEQQTEGSLVLTFRCYVPSLDPRDTFNLHAALEAALYPADDATLEYQRALGLAGATTGLWTWLQPVNPAGRKGRLSRAVEALGQAALAVRSPVLNC